jgi:hypothetical protein
MMLLNQAIISTTGEGGDRARKVATYQMIDSMLAMGLDPDAETDEEKEYVQRKVEQMQQQAQNPQPDAAMVNAQAEMKKGEADLLEQQNRQAEMQLTATKIQADAQGKIEKLQSETQLNVAKIQQEQQKIDIEANDKATKNALTLTGLELQAGVELNKQMQANRV